MEKEPKSNTHNPLSEVRESGSVRLDVAVSIIQQQHSQSPGKQMCSPTLGDNRGH